MHGLHIAGLENKKVLYNLCLLNLTIMSTLVTVFCLSTLLLKINN